ncbi:hypothetical protein [Alkanindiges illinoisensis]|uniref:hypothetical protein n=1 Tax=Alkanindiges illinoisensis TaxID=197183 RepID=UPI00047E62E9|nr:hypothetical protein [Alkanindiges illinoisensis]
MKIIDNKYIFVWDAVEILLDAMSDNESYLGVYLTTQKFHKIPLYYKNRLNEVVPADEITVDMGVKAFNYLELASIGGNIRDRIRYLKANLIPIYPIIQINKLFWTKENFFNHPIIKALDLPEGKDELKNNSNLPYKDTSTGINTHVDVKKYLNLSETLLLLNKETELKLNATDLISLILKGNLLPCFLYKGALAWQNRFGNGKGDLCFSGYITPYLREIFQPFLFGDELNEASSINITHAFVHTIFELSISREDFDENNFLSKSFALFDNYDQTYNIGYEENKKIFPEENYFRYITSHTHGLPFKAIDMVFPVEDVLNLLNPKVLLKEKSDTIGSPTISKPDDAHNQRQSEQLQAENHALKQRIAELESQLASKTSSESEVTNTKERFSKERSYTLKALRMMAELDLDEPFKAAGALRSYAAGLPMPEKDETIVSHLYPERKRKKKG